MQRLPRRTRVGILAAIALWHAGLVLLLTPRRPLERAPEEFVSTWLRLDDPVRMRAPAAPGAQRKSTTGPFQPSKRAVAAVPSGNAAAAEAHAVIETAPPRIDWRGESLRAARDQYAHRLPTPRALESPSDAVTLPSPPGHGQGNGDSMGGGEWRLWVDGRCFTVKRSRDDVVLRCVTTESLDPVAPTGPRERRVATPTMPLPGEVGTAVGRTRTGPAMGGFPGN